MKRSCIGEFLSSLDDWDILIAQEFGNFPADVGAPRLILGTKAVRGQRTRAIVIHHRLVEFVDRDSFTTLGRHCSVKLRFGAEAVTVMSSHLDASGSKDLYRESIDDLQTLVTKELEGDLVIGIDGQTQIGPCEDFDNPAVVGPYAEHGRDRDFKGEELVRFATENSLFFANTFREDQEGTFTCDYDLKFPARQIDYILVGQRAMGNGWKCGIADYSDINDSDHRCLRLVLPIH